jgi:hypothetical protein
MKNTLDREIGETYFVREERVYLVEIVAQRDHPPGRPDRTTRKTLLAGHDGEIAPHSVAGVILRVGPA